MAKAFVDRWRLLRVIVFIAILAMGSWRSAAGHEAPLGAPWPILVNSNIVVRDVSSPISCRSYRA